MSYYESAKGQTITRKRAIHEIERHGCNPQEFLSEVGDRDTYKATDVLHWLGY